MHKAQRLINHVALVLDGSSSMSGHKSNLIRVADEQIRHLALRSEELSQETRVSVYLFSDRVDCLIFDMDVMRLPSIADLYRAEGMTALIAATVKSQNDLATTSQLYGDHAFLTFVLTDGMENASGRLGYGVSQLSDTLDYAADNWSIGWLVPSQQSQAYLSRIGVHKDSTALWDAASAQGIVDSFQTIKTATDNFMTARATGVRGTRTVFSTGAEAVNKATVTQTLQTLTKKDYSLVPVQVRSEIRKFVESQGLTYKAGMAYYQLTKAELIQARKQIVVVDKATDKAYAGSEARHLVGLPDGKPTRVKPEDNPKYEVYVQSTSVNRVLLPNTRLFIKK